LAKDVLRPFTLERSARPLGALVCGGGRKAGPGVVPVPATVFVVVLGLLVVVLPARGAAFVVVDVLVLVEVVLLIVLVVLVEVLLLIVLVVVLVDVLVVLSVVPWQ
jgi:hypothetical protein